LHSIIIGRINSTIAESSISAVVGVFIIVIIPTVIAVSGGRHGSDRLMDQAISN